MESKWAIAWLVVHSFVLMVMLTAIVSMALSDREISATHQERIDEMSLLLHQRISGLVDRLDEQQRNITNLKIQYDPHRRLEDIEKFMRNLCTSPKLEACALLGKIKR